LAASVGTSSQFTIFTGLHATKLPLLVDGGVNPVLFLPNPKQQIAQSRMLSANQVERVFRRLLDI
jgi:hypothetical protein